MISKVSQNVKSQIGAANETLTDLRLNITAKDRAAAQKELDLSEPTITRYLNGKAKRIEVAINLIKFFRERIAERERELAA